MSSADKWLAIRVAIGVVIALVLNHIVLGGLLSVDGLVIFFSLVYFVFHRSGRFGGRRFRR